VNGREKSTTRLLMIRSLVLLRERRTARGLKRFNPDGSWKKP